MSDRFRAFAVAATCAGIACLVVGAFALANMGIHTATVSSGPANPAGRTFLLAGELAATTAFSLAALLCLCLSDRPGQRRLAASLTTALKLAVLISLLAVYWRLWYFMLDLRGPDSLSLPIVLLSGLQAVFLILMTIASAGRSRH